MTDRNIKFGIQWRFIVGSIGLLTLIITIIAGVLLYSFHATSENVLAQSANDTETSLLIQVRKRGKSILDYLSRSLINPVYQFDMDATYNLLKPAILNNEVNSVIVFDKNGTIFHDGDDAIPSYGEKISNDVLLDSVLGQKQAYSNIDSYELTMAQPILISDEVLGGIILTLSLDPIQKDIETITSNIIEASDAGQKKLQIALIVTACVSGIVGILIAVILSRSLVAPIHDLVIHTKKIVKGDYESENKVERDDEIGELAQAFNEMGRSIKRQTQEISFLAYHDSLTKLPNRNMFIKRLTQIITRKKANEVFSVFFLIWMSSNL
ncbi:HAMP domain-containing protein [Vibrio hannami]|uniref:HAMP domain-containing protein n=1 Tax=Vibrio hannami TaxID=2717094 RepID=UPI00240F0549|nr:HAMP domain-containing protein [Vibrio hannami]MDG3089067.1 HAMP domain-containing protein [Vibrio hannami]